MKISYLPIILLFPTFLFMSCKYNGPDPNASSILSIPIDINHFSETQLLEPISIETCRLSKGVNTDCYKIVVNSTPHEHKMGPWCPLHIDDAKDKGGIWFDKGKVYDVDGHFISNIGSFYKDEKWKLYSDDGSIKVTFSQEACEGAAKPNVEEVYKNHCVECQPSFYHDHISTYLIPVTPVFHRAGGRFGRGMPAGIAFNGVNFDPPAPTEAILRAHTLAPLDDCGGHVNPHVGYHYHAVTGCTKEVMQEDGHAPLIGYALDGFGIYGNKDVEGKESIGLDQCRGHEDVIRGYHYHAGVPGSNQILGCLSGQVGSMVVSH